VNFAKVAQVSDIAPGSMTKVVHGNHEVLVANIGGAFYAIPERCPHMGGHLSEGTLQGAIVTCPRHGSQFDVKTGQAVRNPKILLFSMKVKDACAYPLKIEGNDILLGLD
jgi:3-phenylpropionate/trans-cinnamate dioxygenase ferredoxin subunit